MSFPDDYWASYEERVSNLQDFLHAVETISAYQAATETRFIWRGVRDASWGLHSRLFREYLLHNTATPTERQLRAFEEQILEEARRWGLDWHASGGRLSALELIAALQHFGVPTRLIDFTFNPLIALWFACEGGGDLDGRVFAVDISTRQISREDSASHDAWWRRYEPRVDTPWTMQSWMWRPPPIEARMARQEGCFLMGGVPSTTPPRNVRIARKWRPIRAAEVRQCMSIPFRLIMYDQAVAARNGERLSGRPPGEVRAFTLRVSGRQMLFRDLERAFGYSYESLFPDLPGFAMFGRSWR